MFRFLFSSLGKKYLMAITGLGLSLFVMGHMLGNLLIFLGAEAFNRYGHSIVTGTFFYAIEVALLVTFIVHIILAISLTHQSKNARDSKYAVNPNGSKKPSLASQTMIYHGLIILVFLVYHLITFKYGPYYTATYDGEKMRDLHRLVIEVFQSPAYVVGYVFCLVMLGLHLSHGFSSIFKSLGLNHPRYSEFVEKMGLVYSVVVAGGFIAQPIYVYFCV